MSASSLRYQPRPDRNQALRARILALAYVRRRRRKKIPLAERQLLVRPAAANEVWSMDFVFDRIACGRTIKCLVIVDDATHESVAVQPEHSMGGNQLVRFLDQLNRLGSLISSSGLRRSSIVDQRASAVWRSPGWV